VLIVNSKNGADNIRLNRLAGREENLNVDMEAWKILSVNPCSKIYKIYKLKTLKGGKSKQIVDHSYDDAMSVGTTITQKIVRLWADIYNVTTEEDVTKDMLSTVAKKLLIADKEFQLQNCREPNRQSLDEDVQKATLEKYLIGFNVDKPSNGSMTLVEGNIVPKPKDKKIEARSIDFNITLDPSQAVVNFTNQRPKNFQALVFAKYAAVAGSAQQAQTEECERFIGEAKKYIDKHKDGKYFIVLIDGKWGETHLPHMNELSTGYPNIFAGNCESVIDFINSVK
jgi:hypothetical protein